MPAVAGQRAQPADRFRRHETGRDHAPLGDLGQPHAVGPVGLRPAGQRLDLFGVHQLAVEPPPQPEERRLPVIAGCLHHHPDHPVAAQPVGQREDLPLGRAEAAHLVRPPPRVGLARYPDTGLQGGLADIQRSHPLHVQRFVVDLLHHPPRSPSSRRDLWRDRPGSRGRYGKLARVLEATRNGPHGKPAPSVRLLYGLTKGTKLLRRHGRPPAHFHAGPARLGHMDSYEVTRSRWC